MKNLFYLIINAGSSSIKFQLLEKTNDEYKVICKGLAERIKVDGIINIEYQGKKIQNKENFPNHDIAIEIVLKYLKEIRVMNDLNEITAIGHRVVHGGNTFIKPTYITDEVVKKFSNMLNLAPLHNPAHLAVIKACRKHLPNVPGVMSFDTSFHTTMPLVNALYPVPYEWYEENKVQRYGFHGISYEYNAFYLRQIYGLKEINAVICHLGNGSSVCAIENNQSIDTAMGFTPLAGLMMGTRCGDIDPSIHEYIKHERNMTLEEITHSLNKKSGLLGVSGLSPDMREIEENAAAGNERCELALNIYSQRVANYIVNYANKLKGKMKFLVFTAGIGENSEVIVQKTADKLHVLPIKFKKNLFSTKNSTAKHFLLSENDSPIKAMVIKTNEELMICKHVEMVLAEQNK